MYCADTNYPRGSVCVRFRPPVQPLVSAETKLADRSRFCIPKPEKARPGDPREQDRRLNEPTIHGPHIRCARPRTNGSFRSRCWRSRPWEIKLVHMSPHAERASFVSGLIKETGRDSTKNQACYFTSVFEEFIS